MGKSVTLTAEELDVLRKPVGAFGQTPVRKFPQTPVRKFPQTPVRKFPQTPVRKFSQTHVPESGQTPFQSDPERNYMEDVTGWRCFAVEEVRAALACQTVNGLEQLLALAVEKD